MKRFQVLDHASTTSDLLRIVNHTDVLKRMSVRAYDNLHSVRVYVALLLGISTACWIVRFAFVCFKARKIARAYKID